jgi:ParB family chromosome partitioning protein
MAKAKDKYQEVDLDKIVEPDGGLRLEINEEDIEELAKSIDALGLRQAIEVIPRGEKFEIVYGERRVIACRRLGKKTIWAKIVNLSNEQVSMIRATENLARSQLSPIEEAACFQDLRDTFGMSIDQICKKVGRSYGNVKKRIDLLKMSKAIQKAVHSGQLKMSVATELWSCQDEGHQEYLLELAVEHGATKDVVRQWVQDHRKMKRANLTAGDKGGEDHTPLEHKSIYHTCEICDGAVSLSDVVSMVVCKDCNKRIKTAAG